MKKTGLLRCTIFAALVARGLGVSAAAGVEFSRYFTDGTLRIDIVHSGTSQGEELALRRMTKEPVWAGAPSGLLPPWDRGKYRLQLRDVSSGKVIFRKGFGSLFGEWQTTEEAGRLRRSFEESLEMPFPRDSAIVSVSSRDGEGGMQEIFSATIDPRSYLIGRPPHARSATVLDIEVHGESARKVDLLILGDGYLPTEEGKFKKDCERFIEKFFGAQPLGELRNAFNVRAVFMPARDSGIDEPRKKRYADTPLGMTFSTFDLPRYCMTEDVWAVHDAAALAPHDAILLMANSSRYGGGAIYNFYTVFVSDNEFDAYLTVHEFGHGFAGLADEYYTSSVAYNEFYPRGVEPTEPNITALLDPGSVKWAAMVDPDTPIPTPADNPRYEDKVGAFEGAGYAAKGLYRPARDCKMFSKANRNFCPVCERAMVEMIKFYAPDN